MKIVETACNASSENRISEGEVSGHGNRNEVEEFGMDMDIGSGDGTWRLVTSMRLVPAIFQQGINEQQSVANKTSTLHLSINDQPENIQVCKFTSIVLCCSGRARNRSNQESC